MNCHMFRPRHMTKPEMVTWLAVKCGVRRVYGQVLHNYLLFRYNFEDIRIMDGSGIR
jgi:hypothetical protein